jgi:hypothetical protein
MDWNEGAGDGFIYCEASISINKPATFLVHH